ncbi:MAG: DUF2809 domain-containing protein [Gammaproteobacteria bacterium]
MTCGLLSRSSYAQLLPEFISEYAGDTLWALMVFWIVCTLRPDWPTKTIVMTAVAFAFGIEFLQLYHAPWIDGIRNTKIGALILGHGFKFSDLICYSVGVFLGVVIKVLMLGKTIVNSRRVY